MSNTLVSGYDENGADNSGPCVTLIEQQKALIETLQAERREWIKSFHRRSLEIDRMHALLML